MPEIGCKAVSLPEILLRGRKGAFDKIHLKLEIKTKNSSCLYSHVSYHSDTHEELHALTPDHFSGFISAWILITLCSTGHSLSHPETCCSLCLKCSFLDFHKTGSCLPPGLSSNSPPSEKCFFAVLMLFLSPDGVTLSHHPVNLSHCVYHHLYFF